MSEPSMIRIELNGAPREIAAGTSVAALLGALQLRPEAVAVEVAERLVPRAERAARELRAGDRIEIVTLVGGG
jgi:thiamine biosynthesis protein ThiS